MEPLSFVGPFGLGHSNGCRFRQGNCRVCLACCSKPTTENAIGRRVFFKVSAASIFAGVASQRPKTAVAEDNKSMKGYETPTGLKYFDFRTGDGEQTPSWGDILRFRYTLYTIDKSDSLHEIHSTGALGYRMRHGNGQTILGLEEALHSMKLNGRRRIIVPPRIGYLNSATGPFPPSYRKRKELSKLLKEGNGIVVLDVELLEIQPTEDPEGYYSDWTPTTEEMEQVFEKMKKNKTSGNQLTDS